MKVKITALIDNDIISEIKMQTGAKNTTQGLSIALSEWISTQKLLKAQKSIRHTPLEFTHNFSATNIRSLNQRKV
jgi:hypothetical protein